MTKMTPNPSDHIDSIAGQIKDHCMHLECLRDIPDDMQRDLARGVAILKEAGCQQVYVFGSIAEGHVRPDSDIDFAVRGCPAKLFFKLQGRLLVELHRSADLIDLDADPDLAAFLEREAAMIHVD